jgi:hypothetical protein
MFIMGSDAAERKIEMGSEKCVTSLLPELGGSALAMKRRLQNVVW